MRITRLDTVRLAEYPNLVWVEIGTDEGLVGLGETFLGSAAVSAYLHESVAPQLLGGDPTRVEAWSRQLVGYLGGEGPGAETRGNSAVDLALWDLLAQACGQPLYVLLGGRTREAVRIYNTCAGPRYIRERPVQTVDNWGLGSDRYDDLDAFLNRAGELATELLSEGITGMKIWPFDLAAEANEGAYITREQLDQALDPLRRIREAVGSRIDVMLEFHSLWRLPAAKQILAAVAELQPFWAEDPISMTSVDAVAELAASTSVTIAGGEALAGRRRFHDLLRRGALDVAIIDISWTGGLTEALKIASLADSYEVPIAPHDCTGPVVLTAATHLSASVPNALLQETVRAHYRGWYADLLTDLPPIENGFIRPLEGPGLGAALRPELRERPDILVVSSTLERGEVIRSERAGPA